ncbi:MAG: tRNA (guanosine(46)-N7)-methyltransferase TrmB [Bacteroidales bacterium]|nr:tRNA (guanosine(46)-N7)-methyltransferase TrmB [Bacteroidales bacterium]
MTKNKLQKFQENTTFINLFQPELSSVMTADFELKGQWNSQYFKNSNPIVLELGCGKGEYTIGLSKLFPNKNFIGIDIKGARLWRGAKTATEEHLPNVGFVRTRIEQIASFFAPNEVDEIWVTFPDPQPRPAKAQKRLTSSRFLNLYAQFLKPNGIVHLKTDCQPLHEYTREVVLQNGMRTNVCTKNLYATVNPNEPILGIRTFYEQQFLAQGMPITYLNFCMSHKGPFVEPAM